MLNGLDPIIIFHFYKLDTVLNDTEIPLVAKAKTLFQLPSVPIYLSERLTGLFIDSQDRDITIATVTDSLTDGEDPDVTQKAVSSSVNIDITARKDSIGLTVLNAMADLILPKVASKEYSITYMHGSVTIFAGLLEGFTVTETKNQDILSIKIKLSRASEKSKKGKTVPKVAPTDEAVNLNTGAGGAKIPATAPTVPPMKGPPTVSLSGPT